MEEKMPSRIKMLIALTTMLVVTICPGGLMAAGNGKPIHDAELSESGEFRGQVVNESGAPLGDVKVEIFATNSLDTNAIAATKSDADGYFTLSGLRPGLYRLHAGQTVGIYRTWSHGTAPPAANQAALVVAEHAAVRGQVLGPILGGLGFGSVGTVAGQVAIVTVGAVAGMELHHAMNDAS